MRIMHISNNYTPYSGGVVSSLNAILPPLKDAGHDIMLITLDFLNQKNMSDPEWVHRIPSLFNVTYRHNPLAYPTNAYNFIEEKVLTFNPDIIHVHHPFLLGSLGKKMADKHSITCIFTYHTMYEKYAHYIPLPPTLTTPIIKKVVLSFCKDLAAIITPSTGIKQYLESNAITTPLHVLASPLQNHFFASLTEKKKSPFYELLYVGRFVEEKNVPFLIDLFTHLDPQQYRLTLVGYGAQEDQLKHKAYKQYNYSADQIRFIIKPHPDELIRLYRNADLFLFPSQTDTQGLVIAEAMAQGLPVVALSGPGQQDVIQHGENGFIVHSSHEMLATIQAVKNDTILLKKLSESAQKTAQYFKSEAITAQLISLYQSSIQGSSK